MRTRPPRNPWRATALAVLAVAASLASAAPHADTPDAHAAASGVAMVLVTARDGGSLSPCRRGLVSAMNFTASRLPDHRVAVLHGGDASGTDPDGTILIPQSHIAPKLPARLDCDCETGNGGTPFMFARWLADSPFDFAWHVEEDVVFSGDWQQILHLRAAANAVTGVGEDDTARDDERADLVAKIRKVDNQWQKRCRMPGGEGCVDDDGYVRKTFWPVVGMSRRLARAMMDSLSDPDGVNGHQEPIAYAFCRRQEWCAARSIPDLFLEFFELGHWGRFPLKKKAHPTFTAAGLTFGQNLRPNRIYHPLKCEADGGIGKLATEAARASARALATEMSTESSTESSTDDVFLDALSEEVRSAYFEPRPWAIPFRRKRDDEYEQTPDAVAARDEKRKAVGRSFGKPVSKRRDGDGAKRRATPNEREERERKKERERKRETSERGDGTRGDGTLVI